MSAIFSKKFLQEEQGFTFIELMTVLIMLFALTSLSFTFFIGYKTDAEYSKAEVTHRNAQTSFKIGEIDFEEGENFAYTLSNTTGEVVGGDLETMLPGMVVSQEVRIGASLTACSPSSNPLDLHMLLVSEPCRGDKYTRWSRFCGGIEITQEHLAIADPCS